MADIDVQKAKALLMQASDNSGLSLYDHLTEVLNRVLDEKPVNAADKVEDISAQIKAERCAATGSMSLKDVPEVTRSVSLAVEQAKLLRAPEEDREEPAVANVMHTARLFEDSGVGLGQEETLKIYLALKELGMSHPVTSIRFWGKILGLESNYIIAEAQYRDGEEPQTDLPEEPEDDFNEDMNDGEESNIPPPPKSQYKPPPPVPIEEYGSGVNKHVYFVCSEAGTPWIALPSATPATITAARKVKKFFTGRLDAPITSYPPFPGNEADLLRAQIARITASTKISPVGFYTFDEDGDEDEARENFVENEEFEEVSVSELAEPSLSNWVHHSQYILPQGRCTWMNPNPKMEEEEENEEEDEEEEEEEPENGPPLLSPLQNDEPIGEVPAWSARISSTFSPQHGCACLSSNIWPGAFAIAVGRVFENVYIGFGQKASVNPYSPPLPPAPQAECADEVVEAVDPSREEEIAFEESQRQEEEEEEDGEDGEDED